MSPSDERTGPGQAPDSRDELQVGLGRPALTPLTHRAVASALWMFSGSGLQALLRLSVLTILARILGPSEFGVAAAALVAIGLFSSFLVMGVRPALIQRPQLHVSHVRTAFTLSLFMGATFAALIYAAAPFIAREAFRMEMMEPVVRAMALLLPLQSMGIVAAGLLERDLRFDRVVRIDVLSYMIGYAGTGVSMALLGYGVWSLVGAYLVQESIRTLLVLRIRPHPKRLQIEPTAARELVYFGGGFSAARLGNFAAQNGDKWVAGRWLGQEALGFYKYAFELTAMIASQFGTVIDKVLFPTMAQVQSDRNRLAHAYRIAVGMISVLVLPISAAITVAAPELVHLVLGPGWEPVVRPFRILACILLLRATYTASDSLARAIGAVYRRAWRQAMYAASVISLAWIGQHWGLAAMTAGVGLAISLNFAVMADLSRRLARLSWQDLARAHLGALPAFFITFSVMLGTATLARQQELPELATLLVSSAATAVVLSLSTAAAPRWILGSDGCEALCTLLDFVLARFEHLACLPGINGMRSRLEDQRWGGARADSTEMDGIGS